MPHHGHGGGHHGGGHHHHGGHRHHHHHPRGVGVGGAFLVGAATGAAVGATVASRPRRGYYNDVVVVDNRRPRDVIFVEQQAPPPPAAIVQDNYGTWDSKRYECLREAEDAWSYISIFHASVLFLMNKRGEFVVWKTYGISKATETIKQRFYTEFQAELFPAPHATPMMNATATVPTATVIAADAPPAYTPRAAKAPAYTPDAPPAYTPPQSNDEEWLVAPYYEAFSDYFMSLEPSSGTLSPAQVHAALSEQGPTSDQLAQIWELGDLDRDGRIDQREFAVMMYLCWMVNNGTALPMTLPPNLHPPPSTDRHSTANPFSS